jgi:hypothetical protein
MWERRIAIRTFTGLICAACILGLAFLYVWTGFWVFQYRLWRPYRCTVIGPVPGADKADYVRTVAIHALYEAGFHRGTFQSIQVEAPKDGRKPWFVEFSAWHGTANAEVEVQIGAESHITVRSVP